MSRLFLSQEVPVKPTDQLKFENLLVKMDRGLTLSSREGNKDDAQRLQVRSALC